MDDWLLRLLRRFGHPTRGVPSPRMSLERIDTRLAEVEHRTEDLEARLKLVERQTDPRGVFGNHHG